MYILLIMYDPEMMTRDSILKEEPTARGLSNSALEIFETHIMNGDII